MIRLALRKLAGWATTDWISEAVTLPVWSVVCRMRERPDWFAADGEGWKLIG